MPRTKLIDRVRYNLTTEEEANGFAKRSLKKKDVWKVVLYDKENYDKYWYK